jgi:uncharacterized phage protein (TIGR01671 family)
MNREIEFRGKRLDNDEWMYGDLIHDNQGGCYVYPLDSLGLFVESKVDDNTVGQFTSLTDKNGVKIFEGHIVRIYDSDYEEYSDEQVKFAHGVFGVDNWTKKYLTTLSFFLTGGDSEYSVEVIGNIYDNPELLSTK